MSPDAGSERAPTLAEVIRRSINGRLDELHTMLPAVVTSWNPATQCASVKPLVKHAYLDEDSTRQVESLAIVTGVPVQFMGAGGFRLTCPISTGANGLGPATTGMLIFAEASLDRWLSGTGAEVDPEIDHRFQLTDAVFVPGLNPFGKPYASCPNDHATLGADTGIQVHLHSDHVSVAAAGEAGDDFVALAGKVHDALTALKNAISSATVVAGDGGASLKSALIASLTSWPPALASSSLKAT